MSLADAVAAEVRRRMAERGMSQTALARAAGMAPTLLHRAMNGERALQLDEVERIAPALGVTPLWFLRSALTHNPRPGDRSESNSDPRQE